MPTTEFKKYLIFGMVERLKYTPIRLILDSLYFYGEKLKDGLSGMVIAPRHIGT